MGKTILVTGAAGFIGSHTAATLIARGDQVVGLDNLNDYYDPARKRSNLEEIKASGDGGLFSFVEGDIRDRSLVRDLFARHQFGAVAHLAAMAGVRVGQLYKDLHAELTHLPYPPSADTPARRALVEGALRLRYAVLLNSAEAMLKSTVALVERTGEGASWAERAQAALIELTEARLAEEKALAALPYSRAQLEEALKKLSESSPSQAGQPTKAGPKAGAAGRDQ